LAPKGLLTFSGIQGFISEKIISSETSADSQPTTWHYIPEHRTHTQCDNEDIAPAHYSGVISEILAK
jgi:hypothetical protein